MNISLGLVELNSISMGFDIADTMLKASETDLIKACPLCPGKFLSLVSGYVASVKTSVEAAVEKGGEMILDYEIIPSLHEQVIQALTVSEIPDVTDAFGCIEYFTLIDAVTGADAAVKAADIELLEIRVGVGIGGKSFVTMHGDVSAVEEAVEAGAVRAKEAGTLVNRIVIPSPMKELFSFM